MECHHFKGLTPDQVQDSRIRNGVNILTPPPKTPLYKQFIEKFNDPLIKILLVALMLSVGIAFYEVFVLRYEISVFLEPLGILIAVLLATGVGFAVEVNANKKFELLNQVNDDVKVKVIRGCKITEVPRKDIVVGDVVLIETGDEVPADGELLDSVTLSINESTLTGEPVIKKSHKESEKKEESTYPSNHVMRGTTVTEGHGIVRIFAVGDATEYGKVYVEAQIEQGKKTPLLEQFDRLGKLISIMSYVIAAVIVIGRFIIYDYDPMIFTAHFVSYLMTTIMLAVTLIVVSVPEGLPMSVTLSLALSMRRMLATNNLVRKMHACETMGATDIICTDKTGTLTQNQMNVHEAQFYGLKGNDTLDLNDKESQIVAEGISVNSTAYLDTSDSDQLKALGNPTEGALLLWLNSQNIDYLELRENAEVDAQLPFSTERKYMATVVNSPYLGCKVLYMKGAPEIVMGMSKTVSGNKDRDEIKKTLEGYQSKAMRTLGFAYQILKEGEVGIQDCKVNADNLEFLGIAAIADPVREDVPEAISDCRDAGIKVKIITGDTVGTACEIGRQVGLWKEDDSVEENHISGPDFAALSDDEAKKRGEKIKIMSRARPSDKSRLVNLLQENGHVIAVTGDGTNDAPALNAAQVGLSMGDGTAVAKEASDITIMDNSFTSIAKAVMWGRSLYKNIQKFILFQLTVNIVACAIVGIGAFIGYQSPLTVTQMLWVNLIMDTFAALAFASLPPTQDVMEQKPRKNSDFIISGPMAKYILWVGIGFVLVLFGFLQYFKQVQIDTLSDFRILDYFKHYFDFHYTVHDIMTPEDGTMFFTIFVFMQFWSLFNVKSFRTGHSIFYRMQESKVFFTTVLIIFLGQIIIVECGGKMFNVVPLNIIDWMWIIVGTSVIFWAGELVHFVRRLLRKKRYRK